MFTVQENWQNKLPSSSAFTDDGAQNSENSGQSYSYKYQLHNK